MSWNNQKPTSTENKHLAEQPHWIYRTSIRLDSATWPMFPHDRIFRIMREELPIDLPAARSSQELQRQASLHFVPFCCPDTDGLAGGAWHSTPNLSAPSNEAPIIASILATRSSHAGQAGDPNLVMEGPMVLISLLFVATTSFASSGCSQLWWLQAPPAATKITKLH